MQFEAGGDSFLQLLRQILQRLETCRWRAFSIPEIRPIADPGLRELQLFVEGSCALTHRLEQTGGEKSEHDAGRKIAADLTALDLELSKPFPHSELGRVVIMMRRFVQRLQESGVQRERAAGLEDAVNFARGDLRLAQMFEDVEGENAIESAIGKRQSVRIADDIGVAKNFVLELDATRHSHRGGAGAEMKR